jgi:excisionase family DNA binding protein
MSVARRRAALPTPDDDPKPPVGFANKLALRPREVAEAIGCSQAKVYDLIARGQLPSVKIGKARRVTVDALRRYLLQLSA